MRGSGKLRNYAVKYREIILEGFGTHLRVLYYHTVGAQSRHGKAHCDAVVAEGAYASGFRL